MPNVDSEGEMTITFRPNPEIVTHSVSRKGRSLRKHGQVAQSCQDQDVLLLFDQSLALEPSVAKQPTSKTGTSRIRFIMLDAEIPDGDLSQITAAIQNALKPATIVQQRVVSLAQPASLTDGTSAEDTLEDDVIDLESSEIAANAKPSRAPRNRKPTTPDVLDADLTSDVSLESFAGEHPPTSEPERCLVIAAWFKEHREVAAITTSHVYTAYRSLKWSLIEDFGWPLRWLKKERYMSSPARGEYVINHLGIDRVNKLGKGG